MEKINCCALHVFDNQSCKDCAYFILCTNTKLRFQIIFLKELHNLVRCIEGCMKNMSFIISYSDCMTKILCTYSSKSRPSLDICRIHFFTVLIFIVVMFWIRVCCVNIIYVVLLLHCLSYLLTGNIFFYKYLLLTLMHKASRPMYLSDITIQLSGAKSHSRVYIINVNFTSVCMYIVLPLPI